MTILSRIADFLHGLLSWFLNEDNDDRADADEKIETSLCADLDPYLAGCIRQLNDGAL